MADLAKIVASLPPTLRIYWRDSYIKSGVARVSRWQREAGSGYLVLDQSIMHPKAGGQPTDLGLVKGDSFIMNVKKVLEVDQVLVHYGRAEGDPREGDLVGLELDWQNRYHIMRLHTAGHIIDHAIFTLSPSPLESTAAHHGPPISYIEFQGDPTDLNPAAIESLANAVTSEGRKVYTELVGPDQLPLRARGAMNISRLPKLISYRLVIVDGINAIPCGGTHVATTREVGEIKVEEIQKSGPAFRLLYSVRTQI